jgi:hypothetical protein
MALAKRSGVETLEVAALADFGEAQLAGDLVGRLPLDAVGLGKARVGGEPVAKNVVVEAMGLAAFGLCRYCLWQSPIPGKSEWGSDCCPSMICSEKRPPLFGIKPRRRLSYPMAA